MTTAEYFKELNALKDEEKRIKRKINRLLKTFKNELPFKKGDHFLYKGYYRGVIKTVLVEEELLMIQYTTNQYDNSLYSTNWITIENAEDVQVIDEPPHVVRFKKPGTVLLQ